MTALLWIFAKFSKLIDYLTYDLVRKQSWVKDVPPPKTPAGLRPEEAERPFPSPTVVHLSLSGRLEKRDQASPEEIEGLKRAIKKLREQWGDQVAAEELIREIDQEWEA